MSKRAGQCAVSPTGKTGDAAYKKIVAENEERVNHKAAFLSARDAEYAAWREKNGVVDTRTESVDAETGATTITECRGMVCGGAMSRDLGKMYNVAQIAARTKSQRRNLREPLRSKVWRGRDTRRTSQAVLDAISTKWGEQARNIQEASK